jgi:hypothetical protein
MYLKQFFRTDQTQLTLVGVGLFFILYNPIGRVFGINNSSFDNVKIVKHHKDFLKCQKTTPQSISMGGVKKSAESFIGVVGFYTNPTIVNYHGFLCLETKKKNGSNVLVLKPHPKLDKEELITFKTIDLSNIPIQWRKSAPFSSIRAF